MKNEDNGQEEVKSENGSVIGELDFNFSQQITGPLEGIVPPVSAYGIPRPNSTFGTYNSSDKDDTITDDDIAFFLEDRPITSDVPESCPHLDCLQPIPESGINVKAACAVCDSTDENWVCLTCYEVYCSRYINEHMMEHTQKTQHTLTLSLRDITVWCYSCDDYVHDEALQKVIKVVLDYKYGSPTEVLTTTSSLSQ